MTVRGFFSFCALLLLAGAVFLPPAQAAEVNVYSYRQTTLVDPLFQLFERETGIHVNVLFARRGLIERIALEGPASRADVLLAADLGHLLQAGRAIAQPVRSPILESNIPSPWRDPAGYWFALSQRARVVFVRQDETLPSPLTYESLGGPFWQGRICMRDGQHPYNISLIAAMIAHYGAGEARAWLIGLKANLARRPAGGDRAQMIAVAERACDLAVANNYYYGVMNSPFAPEEQQRRAQTLKGALPVFIGGGTHINVSGMAMTRYAPNRANARRLMEFLSAPEAQTLIAERIFEYPINPDVSPPALFAGWGRLRPDPVPLSEIMRHRAEASLLVDETGFNN